MSDTTSSSRTSRPATPSSKSSPPQKPISIEERARIGEERAKQARAQLAPLSSEEVAGTLLDAIRSKDNVMFNAAKNELMARGKKGDETAIEAIRSALAISPKPYLVEILGKIATEGALRAILEILDTSGQNKGLRSAALKAIANIGRHYDQKIPPRALSSLLEEYFGTIPKDNLQLLDSIANGLSTLGMATGIEKLLRFIETAEVEGNLTPEFVNSMTDALREIRNLDAIGPLRARLQQDKEIKREATRMAGEALTSIGHVKATEALLEWASQVKERKHIQRARAWLSQIQDDDSYQMLLHAQEYYRFRDSKMLEMISELIVELDPQRAYQKALEVEEDE